jgi:hypothetical protein
MSENDAQNEAAEKYEYYMLGWEHGTSLVSISATQGFPEPLRDCYFRGRHDGRRARASAARFAVTVFEADPGIIADRRKAAQEPSGETEDLPPPSTEIVADILGLVLMENEMPSKELLEGLSIAEREQVIRWAGNMHFEGSDNDVKTGPAPDCLRRILAPDHYLHRWRL